MKTTYISALLICVLFVINSLASNNTLKYTLNSTKLMFFEPNSTHSNLSLSGDVYVRPTSNKNEYSFTIRSPSFKLGRENGSVLNLAECLSLATTSLSILIPFLGVYDDNGLLQYIKVYTFDQRLSKNVKLNVASLLQFNYTKVNETKNATTTTTTNVNTTELTYGAGSCPLKFDLTASNNSNTTNYQLNKTYNMLTCNALYHPLNHAYGCLEKTCPIGYERQFNWTETMQINLTSDGNATIVENVRYIQNLTYRISKTSNSVIHYNTDESLTLTGNGSYLLVPRFINYGTVQIVDITDYRVPDTQVCDNSAIFKDIEVGAKALGCGGFASNVFMDLYDKAAHCWNSL